MIIYKKDTKGKIRSLEVYNEGEFLFQIAGLLDGKKVTNTKTCKGKNIGKSNETTPEEQAALEVTSKVTEKLKSGYFIELEQAKNETVVLPMLAKDYKKESKKINWDLPVYAQPKLDGMRSIGIKDNTFLSRTGSVIETVNHLHKELNILRNLIGAIPDGELYAHGISFQENMKLIKKYRPGTTEKVHYHVYDLVSQEPFAVRITQLDAAFKAYDFQFMHKVNTACIYNEAGMQDLHSAFLKQGYEGTIIRHGKEGYKVNGRSSNLLKYKDFKDMTATIIDVLPSDARPEQGVLLCETSLVASAVPSQFKASLKFSHEEREEILYNKEKYVGQTAEIRYFEETDSGLPRFPVCVGFRLDKR